MKISLVVDQKSESTTLRAVVKETNRIMVASLEYLWEATNPLDTTFSSVAA